MYNRTPYNRTQYNRKARFVFEWTATANAESGSGGALLVIRYLAGTAEAETSASGEVVRILLFTSEAEAVAEAIGDYIRTLFFEGDAIAEANASGTGVSTYGQEVMVVDRVSDSSVFFKLMSGVNDIIVEGGTTADIRILWKDRWL